MKKHTEIITIEHKGIEVTIHVDYDRGELSLVQRDGYGKGFNKKQWIFANRTLDYMNGWLNIIEAMKYAVEFGKKQLEHDLAEKSKFRDSEISKSLIKTNHRKNANKK